MSSFGSIPTFSLSPEGVAEVPVDRVAGLLATESPPQPTAATAIGTARMNRIRLPFPFCRDALVPCRDDDDRQPDHDQPSVSRQTPRRAAPRPVELAAAQQLHSYVKVGER